MNILVLLDSLNGGGVETREFEFLKKFKEHDSEIFVAGPNQIFVNKFLEQKFNFFEIDFCNLKILNQNIKKINRIIIENDIDIIYLHHWYSIIIGFCAAILNKLPYVVTFHSVPKNLSENLPCLDELLQLSILPNASSIISISPEVEQTLKNKYGIQTNNIIKNTINEKVFKGEISESKQKLVLISRLSNDKKQHLISGINFFTEYNKLYQDSCLKIIGKGNIENEIKRYIAKINESSGKKIIDLLGVSTKVQDNISEADIVLGMGRVVLEAVSCKRKSVLIGYDGVKDILTTENFADFSKTNFSGRGFQNKSVVDVIRRLDRMNSREIIDNYNYLLQNFNLNKEFDKLNEIFYFINHNKLYNRKSELFINIALNLLKAHDLKQQNKFNKCKIESQEQYIQGLLNSSSWKITKPLRILFEKLKSKQDRNEENKIDNFYLNKKISRFDLNNNFSDIKVSIIIPCYNYGQYIEECVDSVLKSTFQDIEILVINDGSTDEKTNQILKTLNKPKTRVIWQHNQGLAQTRNNGIKQAQGKYFLPLDADDTIEPTLIEKAYWILETTPELGYVYPYVQLFGDFNEVWKTMEYNFYDLLWDNQISVCSLVRKQAWQEVGGYNPNMTYGYEDWEFWINLGKHNWHGRLLAEPLFNHRKHGLTMTKTALEKRKYLIEQIKKNHPEIFNKTRLKELKKQWQVSQFKVSVVFYAKKIVNYSFFPSKLKHFLKINYLKIRDKIKKTKAEKIEVKDFNNVFNYKTTEINKPKVLFIVPWLTVGGSEAVMFAVLNSLKERFLPVIVTTIKDDNVWTKKFQQITPFIYHLPDLFSEENHLNFIKKLIKFHQIKTIHLSNSRQGYTYLEELKQNQNLKIIDTIHNTSDDGYLKISADNDKFIDKHVVVSKTIKNQLIDKYNINYNKIGLIYNGIDINKFNPDNFDKQKCCQDLNIPNNKKIITFIGRFSQEKNPDVFVKIAQEMSDEDSLFFIMAGEGIIFDKIKKQIKKAKLKNILLLGNINKVAELLKVSKVLINTSSMEGLSITILEAMSMGVPVIANNINGNAELIENNHNGYLIDNNNPDDFKQKIEILFNDKNNYSKRQQYCREFINKKFTIEKMVEKYDSLF